MSGHQEKQRSGYAQSAKARTGINQKNRKRVLNKNHPRAHSDGTVFNYVIIVEKAIGKYLPSGAVIHHIDGIRSNDINTNLVVCENDQYHKILHRRERALRECGNANYRKCWICGKYDAPENIYIRPDGKGSGHHTKCSVALRKKQRKMKRMQKP